MKRRYKPNLFYDICDQPYSNISKVRLYNSAKDSRSMIQRMQLMKSLPVHTGCVNTICWNDSGEYILSGSDDQRIIVTHGHTYKVLTDFKTIHRANIFSAKFLPCDNDNQIISCAGDGIILFTDLNYPLMAGNQFTCHQGTTYEVITIPNDPHTFLSCGEDGTVRWFDLRQKTKCLRENCREDVLISCHRAVTTIAVNPTAPYQLAIGCSDSRVRLFDRRMIASKTGGEGDASPSLKPVTSYTVAKLEERSYRITSLCFSDDGEELLASYSSDHLYLFNIKDEGIKELSAEEEACSAAQRAAQPAQSASLMRRLRLRGDWSDTGPNARPESEGEREPVPEEVQPAHVTLMQRMTDVLSRMLNDPVTRAALNNNNTVSNNNNNPPNEQPGEDREAASGHSRSDAGDPRTLNLGSPYGDSETTSLLYGRSHELLEDSLRERAATSSPERRSTNVVNNRSTAEVPPERPVPSAAGERLIRVGPGSSGYSSSDPGLPDVAASSSRTEESSQMLRPRRRLLPTSDVLEDSVPADTESHSLLSYEDVGNSQPFESTSSNTTSFPPTPVDLHSSAPAGDSPPRNAEDPTTTAPSDHRPRAGRGHVASAPARLLFNRVLDNMASRQQANALRLVSQSTQTLAAATRAALPRPEPLGSSSGDSDEDESCAWYNQSTAFSRRECKREEARTNVKQTYTGHRNARTMIKEACFWGSDYVMSGSDCGHVFVWDRRSAELVCLLPADQHVVNCLQPHPTLPLLATAGIDHDVKLWAPLAEEPAFDQEFADSLTRRNEVMLEETRDTITVPASFMIRMMACLNQIRRGARGSDPGE